MLNTSKPGFGMASCVNTVAFTTNAESSLDIAPVDDPPSCTGAATLEESAESNKELASVDIVGDESAAGLYFSERRAFRLIT
jgi:hypothetical protein